jgi:hypothetical protein
MEEFVKVELCQPLDIRKKYTSENTFDFLKYSSFDWFSFSSKLFDRERKLYYIQLSRNSQFYCKKSCKTLIVGKDEPEINLLILSDPRNKKSLCKNFNFLCGCDTEKERVSLECEILLPKNLKESFEKSIELGFDGVIVQHDSEDERLRDGLMCQNLTLLISNHKLRCHNDKYPEKCYIVQYAKKNNSKIRKVLKTFPSVMEIDELLKLNSCEDVSFILFQMITSYLLKL